MTKSTYTKIVKSKDYNDNKMSIGFRRLICLPALNRKKISQNFILENKTDQGLNDYFVIFFGEMSEIEYKEYIIKN